MRITVADEEAMVALGEKLGRNLPAGSRLYLRGDLGAGKTTLTRGIARALGHRGAVKSPTYTLVEPYETLTPVLYHFDLYRVGDAGELAFLGLEDYFNDASIVVVEWPERGAGFLPAADLEISIAAEPAQRIVMLSGTSDAARRCLERLGDGP
jgi:tRNA threonylcarbamoyladenosine biosynthesis protein TsaE